MDAATRWANETFGGADLGHQYRTDRLVKMSAEAAKRPAGRVTQVYRKEADQLGAYRWLENPAVDAQKVIGACRERTVERAADRREVVVPIDGSSLAIFDPRDIRDVGRIGNNEKGQRGLKMVNAIAVSPEGQPLGLCAQQWWARKPVSERVPQEERTFWDKETSRLIRCAWEVEEAVAEAEQETQLWFQIDRAGDYKEAWHWADSTDHDVTIRINQTHRKIVHKGEQTKIQELFAEQGPQAIRKLRIRKGPGGQPRCVRMGLNWTTVTFEVTGPEEDAPTEKVDIQVLRVRQLGDDIDEDERLEWWLGTTKRLDSGTDAQRVIDRYEWRWRIEEFHRTWKSICKVEKTRLEDKDRIIRWATILASVAMRIERLKRLSRQQPEREATEELTQTEIDALILLKEPDGWEPGEVPPIGKAVRWIADLGGYTNPHQEPPGTTVIQRGLDDLEPAVRLLEKGDSLKEVL